MRYLSGLALLSVLFVWIQGSGCGPGDNCEDVTVNEVFVSAFRSPETFDADHSSLQVHVGASQCLRDFAQEAFRAENDKLVECGQLTSGSSAWNARFSTRTVSSRDTTRVTPGTSAIPVSRRSRLRSSSGSRNEPGPVPSSTT